MIVNRLSAGDWRQADLPRRAGKSACVVRYGGFGDMIMASAILPALKAQGYHVTFNCSEKGVDIIRTDPNVDEVFLQRTNQVPVDELQLYLDEMAKGFDRFINLSQSVETKLLPSGERVEEIRGTRVLIPANERYNWSDERRRAELNINYIEHTFQQAGLEFNPRYAPKFYPTRSEKKRAKKLVGSKPTVVWALSGSSVHKSYPWVDSIIAAVLLQSKRIQFVLVGDDYCRILEQGWEDEPRVICTSGNMSIRDTLALAQQATIVIGPETGVLNAVSSDRVRKIIYLSHSTVENLTKHWVNTMALAATIPCYPCHRLHHGFRDCVRDERTGAALCAAEIEPEIIYGEIMKTVYGKPRLAA